MANLMGIVKPQAPDQGVNGWGQARGYGVLRQPAMRPMPQQPVAPDLVGGIGQTWGQSRGLGVQRPAVQRPSLMNILQMFGGR